MSRSKDFMTVASAGGGKTGFEWKRWEIDYRYQEQHLSFLHEEFQARSIKASDYRDQSKTGFQKFRPGR
jgi:hypothetical protein